MAPGSSVDVEDLPPEVRVLPATANVAATALAWDATREHRVASAPAVAATATAQPSAVAALAAAPSRVGHPVSDGASLAISAAPVEWQHALSNALSTAIQRGEHAPGERLTREFEATLIRAALTQTKGRRIEASEWLGWGRNTLTRKIHELEMDGEV